MLHQAVSYEDMKVTEKLHDRLQKYIVKPTYAKKVKYYHNCISNPEYPKKLKKKLDIVRDKFTIIGDYLSKEYMECCEIVTLLYKYRQDYFDCPIQRGVTSIQWPSELNKLKFEYGEMVHCLDCPVAVLYNNIFIGGNTELKELINTKYTCYVSIDHYKRTLQTFIEYIRTSGRPCTYMHIAIDDIYIGSFIFMLYIDLLPHTCENFLRLCNLKKGGYSGTPIHRIVKNGWIQCGGFGLKSATMSCENYTVPHDRRGVLCMANDGRHCENSTQFFVILQPAEWMAHKYVAFGQLIDGEETLTKIENIPTYYESPLSKITIIDAGILNVECHNIRPNKEANEYVEAHIENVLELGDILMIDLMERLYLEIEFREIMRIQKIDKLGEHTPKETKREEVQEETESKSSAGDGNAEYDVEQYVPEEYSYKHVSLASEIEIKPEKQFYHAFTDVPYPGEVSSEFDLKRFLQGNYCLEGDLITNEQKKKKQQQNVAFSSQLLPIESMSRISTYTEFQDQMLVSEYLQSHLENLSFAGDIIKGIARSDAKTNIFENIRRKIITNDNTPEFEQDKEDIRLKRRQTGFVCHRDSSDSEYDMDTDDHKNQYARKKSKEVRIQQPDVNDEIRTMRRRPTGFIRPSLALTESTTQLQKESMMGLFENDANETVAVTLKDYRPLSEMQHRNTLLSATPFQMTSEETAKDRLVRQSVVCDNEHFDEIMNLQHSSKFERKISTDYVSTLDQSDRKQLQNSIRGLEFSKARPSITVTQYHMKNKRNPDDGNESENNSSTELA